MSKFQETKVLSGTTEGISEASRLLKSGALVAFPTETVYGLGADARDGNAVAKIFESKRRPSFNPLIVHVHSLERAQELIDLPNQLLELAKRFWPGPLTLISPLKEGSGISELVSSGLETLAVRIPSHALALKLLKEFDGPLSAPSANPSGCVSPTSAAHVLDGLDGLIAAVIDGGDCQLGLESTIIGYKDGLTTLLRSGGLSLEEASKVTPIVTSNDNLETITAPGQLRSHYATGARIRLNVDRPQRNEAYLAFGNLDPSQVGLDLSAKQDLSEAAANLFAHLRTLDKKTEEFGLVAISVAPIPMTGLGLAINDRLTRAAAPKDV